MDTVVKKAPRTGIAALRRTRRADLGTQNLNATQLPPPACFPISFLKRALYNKVLHGRDMAIANLTADHQCILLRWPAARFRGQ